MSRPYWTGSEAFDACHAELLRARNEVREMAQRAAHDVAGNERDQVKHAVREALVQAVRHLDDGMERLTEAFGVASLRGPQPRGLREVDSPQATEQQLGRVVANRGRSFGDRHVRAS